MNTIIEIEYKNYTENVIVTRENHEEIVLMLVTDKDVLNYEVIVSGDVDFTDFEYELTMDLNGGKNVGVIRRFENTLYKMRERNYFETNAAAYKHWDKIRNLEKNIQERESKLTNLEKLYI